MRAVVQRVSRAKVTVGGVVVGKIARGLVVLLGITHKDTTEDADYLLDKVLNLRIFDDAQGKMNVSLVDAKGALLVISQFTLYGDTRHGRRPSFVDAAPGIDALTRYDYFVAKASGTIAKVATGEFGAMMDVELVNDGPVTIMLDSEKTF